MLERSEQRAGDGRIAWVCLGVALVIVGFLLDPVTVVGHHLMLIVGGVVVGRGLR